MSGARDGIPVGAVGGVLVVGLGSLDRGDDAVGPVVAGVVADVVADHGLEDVRVVQHEDPTALIDLWSDAGLVVVVDAVVSGQDAGTIHVLETGAGEQALPASAWSGAGRAGTHGFGLGASVELARALRRLPPRLVLLGIEASCFDHGAPLSRAVAAAVGQAVTTVLAVLADAPSSDTLWVGGEHRVPR
jgi:hydrogenase maturation protease